MAPQWDRFAGSLLGQALGDALGLPVEGHAPASCRYYVDTFLDPPREDLPGRWGFPFGQYTDDTQLARELLSSMVDCRGFQPVDYATRIGAIFTENRIVGRGRATEQAALKIAAGCPWDESGTPSPAAGNGSAMRAGPVGLVYGHDVEALVAVARDQGRITHQDPRCIAGSVAVATAVARAAESTTIDPSEFIGAVAEATEPFHPPMAAVFRRLPDWIGQDEDSVAREIASLGAAPEHGDAWQGISPYVLPSVTWALYSFLRSPEDYWETIRCAIAVGGDVDTTAAMAGGVSGAFVGLDGLPAEFLPRLGDQGDWGQGALVALARRAHDLAVELRAGEL